MNRLKSKYTQYVVKPSGGGGGAIEGGYLVRFIVEGEPYCNISVLAGDSVQEPSEPSGVILDGWYTAETGGQKITFPFTPAGNTTIYAHVEQLTIVGFIGMTNANPGITLTDDIANVGMWSTSTDGNYVTVSNPLDNHWPFNKIEEFTDSNGNVFVKFPKMWMKWITDSSGNIDGVKLANYKVDDNYFISDAFLDPKDTTCKTYLNYFALGKYEGSGNSNKLYSKSGQNCFTGAGRVGQRIACRAYGNASNFYLGYQLFDIQQFVIYNLLCMAYYRTKNIQTVFAGRTGYPSASIDYFVQTGTCDGVIGMNGWNTSTECVKMLGIENPYGNMSVFIDGIVFKERNIYIHRLPQNYSDDITSAYSIGFQRPQGRMWVSALHHGTSVNTQSAVYCEAGMVDGSDTTYFGDMVYSNEYNSGVVLFVGGSVYNGTNAGLWFMSGWDTPDNKSLMAGGRLAYRPINE